MKEPGTITDSGFNHFLLSKLKINGSSNPDQSCSQVSPPGSPSIGTNKMVLLSPITPLEWCGSPVKPWKKLKGAILVDGTEDKAGARLAMKTDGRLIVA